jgi:hypothetical protein
MNRKSYHFNCDPFYLLLSNHLCIHLHNKSFHYDEGEFGGMIGRGNRSTRIKPAPVQLCPPQTSSAARTRTLATAVGSQRLSAWATAQPTLLTYLRSWALLHQLPIVQPLVDSQTYRHLWADCLDKMWESWRLKTLWVFTVCYKDSFIFLTYFETELPSFIRHD